ncbi:GFA family protein [Sulfitobacter sp. F26169L]|uniref:GFA family protein n=1 Tax=Sulfitobacter sp. F26169L TaxID=2996015 RepID=UPI003A4C5168
MSGVNSVRSGQCACGAVTFSVRAPNTYGACHCRMCRRWCGGVWMGIVCDEIIEIGGDITHWKSSKIGSRGSCKRCGSSIWYKPCHSKKYTFGQGLFNDQEDWTLTREIFCEDKPIHYAFTQDRQVPLTGLGTLVALLSGRLPK